jgi:hypothetical protein
VLRQSDGGTKSALKLKNIWFAWLERTVPDHDQTAVPPSCRRAAWLEKYM